MEKIKIMIVDDNSSIRRILKVLCDPFASSIVECRDGDEAVALYAESGPDLVVMDIEMVRMDGITATSLITREYPDAHILMLTNLIDPYFREASMKAGARGFLSKENLSLVVNYIEIFLETSTQEPGVA